MGGAMIVESSTREKQHATRDFFHNDIAKYCTRWSEYLRINAMYSGLNCLAVVHKPNQHDSNSCLMYSACTNDINVSF